ncbi:flagellar biosynthesis protein FlhF [Aliiglaciecola sp. 3_MG-2023]|uniref:flagellar biosynthesis protein FlhF n=1 Tax=Aliiglaciecola sp. 3_MG-2023 TaxID=3062644 RepID=UPI0026E4889D|nr:flagellar biosynthesis protein FlhF [Aliiglaciecola sp. 3_MG-2023]MDO6693935.1 flagellar biosynthesis protein FlhF [Aliiglaciecola sp. 3_MG-2023]
MKIRRFIGKDMRDALNQVKKELGGDAVIMSNKKTSEGIEIVAAYDQAKPEAIGEPNHINMQPSTGVNSTATTGKHAQSHSSSAKLTQGQSAPVSKQKVPSLSEIIGDTGPDSLRELLEKQAAANSSDAQSESHVHNVNNLSQVKSATPETVSSSAISEIKSELNSLRNVLQFQVSGLLKQERQSAHPMHGYLTSRLVDMGISSQIADDIVSYTPENADERQAWLFLLKLLSNRIQTTGNAILADKGVVALVGPTGTGKTTTIAKLAARAAQKYGADQIAMVTIDSYRIAAFEQLATYGKIIGCSVKKAQNAEELSDILFQLRNKRLVLIDTAGFGQRDSRLIKQLDTLNQHSCANIKKYVVIQANAQYKVLEHTLSAFSTTDLQGCILTKLDESYSLGEALSVAIEHKLAVSYLTDGQRVPEDIKVADAKFLISAAAKLYKKYGLIHTANSEQKKSALAI